MKLKNLKPNPNNPRNISTEQLRKLKKSIEVLPQMMELRPIIYDPENMEVLGGNQRLAALTSLGFDEIPETWCKAAANLTKEQKKEFILRDNAQFGEWDFDILNQDFADFDLEEMGITLQDFSTEPKRKAKEDGYILPAIETIATDIKLGDIIQIGEHRIICGDSTLPETYAKLLNGVKADMVFTDPPYNVNYSGKGKRTAETIANDNMTPEAFREFLFACVKNIAANVKSSGGCYVCHSYREQRNFEESLIEAGLIVKNQIIWVKPSPGMGMGDYRQMHELLFYAHHETKAKFYGEAHKQYTVWKPEYSDEEIVKAVRKAYEHATNGRSTVWEIARDNVGDYVHPTQKPILLCARAIENSSKTEDIVLDAFLGSGSTMVAAEQTGRICYGIEMEPRYCQAIIDRMIELQPAITVLINEQHYKRIE